MKTRTEKKEAQKINGQRLSAFIIICIIGYLFYYGNSVENDVKKAQKNYDEAQQEYQQLKDDSCLIYEQFCD